MAMTLTPSRKKSVLQTRLRTDRVLTTVQLERQGLLAAADALDLPQVTFTCRTRVTQPRSRCKLTYVALEEGLLDRPPHLLMHDAGLAETRARSPELVGGTFKHLDLQGKERGHLPDAVYLAPHLQTAQDWAIEFDAGYDPETIEDKLRGADRQGYARYLWATTIRARTAQIGKLLRKMHAIDPFSHLQHVEARFVDFWSPDPYQTSPRMHKRLNETFFSPAWDEVAQ